MAAPGAISPLAALEASLESPGAGIRDAGVPQTTVRPVAVGRHLWWFAAGDGTCAGAAEKVSESFEVAISTWAPGRLEIGVLLNS